MKIIISHDVDHLYTKEHWLRDLYFPKLWVRSVIGVIKKQINFKQCMLRIKSCFRKEMNHIDELTEYDSRYSVDSTFFFGMNQGLGMSYRPEEAREKIELVKSRGLDIGVHGICFDQEEGISREFDTFKQVTGVIPEGIRMHYVRYDEGTFSKEAKVGYKFDSTEFDKKKRGTIKKAYKVNGMWEFPLTIMDVYLPYSFSDAKRETKEILNDCKSKGLNYVTILFHDNHYDDAYLELKRWYNWLVQYVSDSNELEFISFAHAVEELEKNNGSERVTFYK